MGLFDFLKDRDNYEERKVAHDEFPWGFVSTVRCSDGAQPYETAVSSTEYREGGKMIVVEAYDSREEASAGHDKWTKLLNENPPDELTDCCNAELGQLVRVISKPGELTYKRRK